MSQRTLSDWLSWQETLHPSTIELGLARLEQVLRRLNWQQPAIPVIVVGGTNGKGSCVAMLDSILTVGGYRVGTFTSPHLVRYNERIRVAGFEAADAALIAAFERIDAARGATSLTFFEFNTLAALLVFEDAKLDVMVLEVGLGGRLDAVNVVDADVAVISSVALDHCEWLGNDVESIGREKAGIFRPGRVAVFGSRAMPQSVVAEANRMGAMLQRLGVDFDFEDLGGDWHWRKGKHQISNLPVPALFGVVQFENASAVIAALVALHKRLPLTPETMRMGLQRVSLAGRFQIIPRGSNEWILDVAHNPAAASTLAHNLAARPCTGRTVAVCGMFADKDVAGVVANIGPRVDEWVVAGVGGARAMAPSRLAELITTSGGRVVEVSENVAAACDVAQVMLRPQDRVVVFGSFHTVGPALEWLLIH
jgi:dihydrofolate synthase/folylpolyglutamate synthase